MVPALFWELFDLRNISDFFAKLGTQYQRTSGCTTSPVQGLTERVVVNSSLSVQIARTSLFQARV